MGADQNLQEMIQNGRHFFQRGLTLDVDFRIEALRKFQEGLHRHEEKLMEALKLDLNKSPFEAYSSEIGMLREEISLVIKQLRRWAKPTSVKGSMVLFGARGRIHHEPFGQVLIISPWNYPLLLSLSPLIGAIAAGNTAILKPSELAVHSAAAIANFIEDTFTRSYGEGYVSVAQGGVETSTELLSEKFDYIFFTGGTAVGRVVMEAAAKHLTPVTLELGGKSPCIVHRDADVQVAAKRIVWGKFLNSGQTCVAPDYVLVHADVKDQLIRSLKEHITQFYGSEPLNSNHSNLPNIINNKHFQRLKSLLEASSGTIVCGGTTDEARKLIAPTLIDRITWEDAVMADEIFGPILPIMTYTDLEREVVEPVTARPKPLALYLFTESTDVQKLILGRISFGGGCINDAVMHLASKHMPFGGVGASGMGGYHGKSSFDLFSHHKSVLKQTTRFDIPFRYPTMKNGLAWIKRFMK